MIQFWIGRWGFTLLDCDNFMYWGWNERGYDGDWQEWTFGVWLEIMRMDESLDEYRR